MSYRFEQKNISGENSIIIEQKGDKIYKNSGSKEKVYVKESVFTKIVLATSLIANLILIWQFIN